MSKEDPRPFAWQQLRAARALYLRNVVLTTLGLTIVVLAHSIAFGAEFPVSRIPRQAGRDDPE
jgi:hypothetical protein